MTRSSDDAPNYPEIRCAVLDELHLDPSPLWTDWRCKVAVKAETMIGGHPVASIALVRKDLIADGADPVALARPFHIESFEQWTIGNA